MDLTDDERDLILAGLFELSITYVEDDEKRERCKALLAKQWSRAVLVDAMPPRYVCQHVHPHATHSQ